jgi:hypothetical protein
MKHASVQDLAGFEDLITRIRSIGELKERTPLHFYYKGRGILHFHIDSDVIYADLAETRIRLGSPGNHDESAEHQLYESLVAMIK